MMMMMMVSYHRWKIPMQNESGDGLSVKCDQ